MAELKRSISLPLITLYGLGTIIGAGIFVLVGEVAAKAGLYSPIAFLLASVVAAFTGLSYAELSSRFPKSAGEAVYLQEAFHWRWLSTATGLSVIAIGTISAATIANGAVGYINLFVELPPWLTIVLLVVLLALLAGWGISESIGVAAFTTAAAILTLLAVVLLNLDHLATLPARLPELLPPFDVDVWSGIVLAAFLAFYAFIGFEDMVNVAEEVKNPSRNMPLAIILALVITTLLYVLVALTAVLTLPLDELAASKAPLAAMIGGDDPAARSIVGAVSVVAVVDGALIQIIMASRVLYGMSRQRMLPALFAQVHPKTRTPLISTATIAAVILLLALFLPLVTLAQATSFITLIIFGGINLALWKLKLGHAAPATGINVPLWVPVCGFLLCGLFILAQLL